MKTKQHTKRSFIPTSGASAYAEIHDEIAAVSDELLVPINIDIAVAIEIALAAADRVDELMPQLAQLSTLDIGRIRKLRLYAAACQYAHALATAPEQDPRLRKLLEEGAKLRDDLLATARLLVQFGDVTQERVDSIRTGIGFVDLAYALEQLGILFEELWDRVESRIPVTAEMVERAPELALELHSLLGAKKVRQGERSTAQQMRQRAYTLLVTVYEECQSAVEFLRRHQDDADSFTPSLFVKKRRRTAPEEEPPVTEAPESTTPANTTPAPTPSPLSVITELEPTG